MVKRQPNFHGLRRPLAARMVGLPMSFAVFCLSLIAHATGLVAPGWLAARLLGWRAGWAWAAAVPLSMLFLFCGAGLFDALGVPLRLGPMAAWVLAGNAALALALWKWPARATAPAAPESPAAPEPSSAVRWQTWLLLGGVAVMVALAVWRGFLAPLSGFDTTFRWDFLARVMLREQSLAFYPPRTAAEFSLYFHPDGFAPLVSVGYWWVHLVSAVAGGPASDAVMPMVVAQYAGALALAGGLAAHLAGARRAGVLAVALLAGTPLFFRAVLIGQETGLTAAGLAGMLLALTRAEGVNRTRALVLAGLFAGVAGLAREYGPALVAVGGLALLGRRFFGLPAAADVTEQPCGQLKAPGFVRSWRALLIFGGVAALLLAPWHLRSWLRDGNPLYGHALGGLFPVNPVAAALMEKYHGLFGFAGYTAETWGTVVRQLVAESGLVLLLGAPAAVWLARRAGWLAAGAALGFALWLASVPYTSGGAGYAMRVLSPALVALAVAAAVGLERFARGPARVWLATAALLAALGWTAFYVAVFPLNVAQLTKEPPPGQPAGAPGRNTPLPLDWGKYFSAISASPAAPGAFEQAVLTNPQLARVLRRGTRVLTENAYAHAALANAGGGCDLVPIWSPEVAFLFDPKLDAAEQRRRLRAAGITLLLLYPTSPNTKFLAEASAFYRASLVAQAGGYATRWPVVVSVGVFAICEVPEKD
jgi:hypothetical protein